MARVKKTAVAEPIHAIKGFDNKLACRGFEFKEGETYRHEGPVKACEAGFHVITGNPLAVFNYYPPAGSKFHRVEISGAFHSDDEEKTAAEILKVGKEIGLTELVQEAAKWITDRATATEGNHATGYQSAASATGDRSAASATGDQSAASALHSQAAAFSTGYEGKVSGIEGSSLHLDERAWDGTILNAWGGIVGRDGIKPSVFYTLRNGKPVEV